MTTDEAAATASAWLEALAAALATPDIAAATALFGEECYWRDLVSFTWNIRTVEGHDGIAAMLQATLPHVRPSHFVVKGGAERDGDIVVAWFTFETAVARGVAVIARGCAPGRSASPGRWPGGR